ncbi:alpha/beta hydrolase [Nodosilinea sp. P-1105]|uniref:esterase/lipase family protein n=1 Tax=Nodosilinea sp. P-1105 TaxID=2546229 RepID=UPI00146AB094|nr:alpha/beta hydrolase [Nodosilinea sp. P-1105]NMF84705.1 alpha/beta hydrolase [Nodosilinea sp. P-1105]
MHVVLIHGLARTPMSLIGLARYLQRSGHTTELFSYFAFAESFDAIVQRLKQRFQTLGAQGSYGVVAHSLGGLLTRAALEGGAVPPPVHVVMLGTPNQPPRLAPLAWRLLPFQWFTGQCGFNLTCKRFYRRLPLLPSPYTLVAGTKGFTGAFSPFGQAINDGIVALCEIPINPDDPVITVTAWHTFMMDHPQVQAIVGAALAGCD